MLVVVVSLIAVFCLMCYVAVTPLIFVFSDAHFDSHPLRDAEIEACVTVSEEKITGKTGWGDDGTIYKKCELSDEEMREIITEIDDNIHWKKGSLSDDLKYEISTVSGMEEAEMLEIDNGYFFFKDMHSEASGDVYVYDDELVNSRYSYHYIIAALDVEEKVLYYFQLDT